MAKSTTIIAFDQHAATTVAAVLLPGQRTPALHHTDVRQCRRSCASSSASARTGRAVLLRSRALRLRASARAHRARHSVRRHRAGADPASAQAIALKPTAAMRATSPSSIAPTPSPRFTFRPSRKRRRAISCDAAKISAPTCYARVIGCLNFLLRHGRRFTLTKRAWTKRHAEWLQAQRWPLPALEQTHRAYLRAVDEAVGRLQAVDAELRDLLTLEPLRARVERLRCFRGIDDLTALTIAAELGDPRRFPTAPSLMAFTGLVPSEHSSGPKQARGPITKTGNAHLRRVLVEAAWQYRHHAFLGPSLHQRQRGAPSIAIDIAWRAQRRLHRRYRSLAARGKPKQHIVTAVARELTGFLWAALTQ